MVDVPIYFDLSSSSDEEGKEKNGSRDRPTAVMCLPKAFRMDVDDDDVRIIDKPASNGKMKRNRVRVVRGTVDDDDCCILDTDPGAADAVPDVVSPHNSDELVMTGEKGPVACRDFPHARYLCVHFPFKSTLHSEYCAQCHCYVCDSLAPCSLWGEGNCPTDHCHASEEEQPWKNLRKFAKHLPFSLPPISTTKAADPAGESGLVQTTLLQTLPSSPVLSIPPVDSPGGVLRVDPAFQRDPLVIQLKGKGRGKHSQPAPQHLGVKHGRQLEVRCRTILKKSAPGGLVPRSAPFAIEEEPPLSTLNRCRGLGRRVPTIRSPRQELLSIPPNPISRSGRTVPATTNPQNEPALVTPNPNLRSGRVGGGIPPSISPRPQSPLNAPNPDFRPGRAGAPVPQTLPNPNSKPERAVPSTPTSRPRSTRSVNSLRSRARDGVAAASPTHQGRNPISLPSRAGGVAMAKSTAPQLPQPPVESAVATLNSASAATSRIPAPSPVANDDAQARSVSAIPPRYDSAGPLRPRGVSGSDFTAQGSRTAVKIASSSHGGGPVDILAGPIEGWEMHAAAVSNALAPRGSPAHVSNSRNDVIQEMAAGDNFWEPACPGWQ